MVNKRGQYLLGRAKYCLRKRPITCPYLDVIALAGTLALFDNLLSRNDFGFALFGLLIKTNPGFDPKDLRHSLDEPSLLVRLSLCIEIWTIANLLKPVSFALCTCFRGSITFRNVHRQSPTSRNCIVRTLSNDAFPSIPLHPKAPTTHHESCPSPRQSPPSGSSSLVNRGLERRQPLNRSSLPSPKLQRVRR